MIAVKLALLEKMKAGRGEHKLVKKQKEQKKQVLMFARLSAEK